MTYIVIMNQTTENCEAMYTGSLFIGMTAENILAQLGCGLYMTGPIKIKRKVA